MHIRPVSSILAPAGFGDPTLNVLVPNADNYKALLMQPRGEIEASAAGVFSRHRALVRNQFGKFLAGALATQADLVVTPEYSMPWEVLAESLKAERAPAPGKLWVLGCESIRYDELALLKDELAEWATVLYEEQEPDPQRFVDPLAYVFLAPPLVGNGAARVVVLVQFKTHPMSDPDHFEVNGLQRGTCIYQFGATAGQEIRLVSMICSDAFAFLDAQASAVYDRALVIHIQLNPSPRHEQYRQYRDKLLRFQGDATELICLNWAGNVLEWCNGQEKPWYNVAASAWYLKPEQFDYRDATLGTNHKHGLYYTWLAPLRVHALFFNYQPATYQIHASKVAHLNVAAAVSRRRGPQLVQTCVWPDNSLTWNPQANAEDGFADIVDESGSAKEEIIRIANENPLGAERVLALCAGKIAHNQEWHKLRHLDSCTIDATEIIKRITFCQDSDPRASEFRTARLRRCRYLWDTLTAADRLPPALKDFADGFRFEWSGASPHQNAISNEGRRATVVYMGEEATSAQIEAVSKWLEEFLGRSFTGTDEVRDARQRLAVWYRNNDGNIVPYDTHNYARIDKVGNNSPLDIGREQ